MRDTRYGTPCTERQIEILKHAADGLSNAEIGRKMFISTSTVEVHLRDISVKLGSRGKINSVAIALRTGIFS